MKDSYKKKVREDFRKLQDGDFFDTDKDGDIYFHADKVADYWINKMEEHQREVADKFKHKFNGYGGTLGFTLNDILSIIEGEK